MSAVLPATVAAGSAAAAATAVASSATAGYDTSATGYDYNSGYYDAGAAATEYPSEWAQYVDEASGLPYWYNVNTGETAWAT